MTFPQLFRALTSLPESQTLVPIRGSEVPFGEVVVSNNRGLCIPGVGVRAGPRWVRGFHVHLLRLFYEKRLRMKTRDRDLLIRKAGSEISLLRLNANNPAVQPWASL